MALQAFTVRFAAKYFYVGRDALRQPLGTFFQSRGLMMSYPVALEVAKNLRDLGYSDAVVCTSAGRPALPEHIDAAADDLDAVANARTSQEYLLMWGTDPEPLEPEWEDESAEPIAASEP